MQKKLNFLKFILWYPSAIITLIATLLLYQTISNTKDFVPFLNQELSSLSLKQPQIAFAALPKTTQEIKTALTSQDARPLIINKYLARWGSPLEGMGHYIVQTADKYGVDPYIIIAIAQQESNLGKKMPPHCYNAWGWGIHSKGTLCFSNWYEAIDKFTKGLAENYYAYGLKTPQQIMSKYNPHSPNQAWAKGVSQFLHDLQTGNF